MIDTTYEIRRAGISSDGNAVLDMKATNGAFDWRWIVTSPDRAREFLAVALTAIASNKLVGGLIDENANFAVIQLYLVK